MINPIYDFMVYDLCCETWFHTWKIKYIGYFSYSVNTLPFLTLL